MAKLESGLVNSRDYEDYLRDGAIVVRHAIDLDWVERLRLAAARVVEQMLLRKEAEGQPRPTGPAFHNVLFMYKFDRDFREIALRSPLAAVARDLMQAKSTILFVDHLLAKEPGTQEKTPWHHDLPYWPITGGECTSAWLALDPVTRENGSMEYVAGSHLWGRQFQPQGFDGSGGYGDFEPMPDIDGNRDRYRIIQWDLEPGDALFHNPLTLHGAGMNQSKSIHRRGLAIRYVDQDMRWAPFADEALDGKPGPEFAPPLQKGDPLTANGAYEICEIE